MDLDDFFEHDPLCTGAKGLVFIGEKLLVYRRDTNTDKYPLCIDLPGGGTEAGETPFGTFKREVSEEFGLSINPSDVVYVKKYLGATPPKRTTYFPVVRLSQDMQERIVFGDEGVEYLLIDLDDYIKLDDAWPVFQERTADYLKSQANSHKSVR